MTSNNTSPTAPKMPPSLDTSRIDNTIVPAKLTWCEDEQGNLVPVSDIFGDVYYSLADGLAESRYVFLEQNNLPKRFETLFSHASFSHTSSDTQAASCAEAPLTDCFTIAELGFGTGLNLLATWQLWDQVKQSSKQQGSIAKPRLHFVSTEKFPLSKTDLSRSLDSWKSRDTSLTPYIDKLLALYPTLVNGCHRLHLDEDVTLDLWLGDAVLSLQSLSQSYETGVELAQCPYIDAWYLDGFAPACNESLWAQQIFEQVGRLSTAGSTVATFSSAGIVKRGLKAVGFEVKKTKGFGRKREMLTAIKTDTATDCDISADTDTNNAPSSVAVSPSQNKISHITHVAIVGSGISGLMAAWALAERHIKVTLIDKSAPLAGASGNPRALLAPKMTPLHHVAEHLHSMSYLYSQQLYRQWDTQSDVSDSNHSSPVFEATGTLDLLLKANIDLQQIAEYPDQMATTLTESDAKDISGLEQQSLQDNLYLPQAGLINPQALATHVLTHPNITFKQATVEQIDSSAENNEDGMGVELEFANEPTLFADAVIISAALDSQSLDARIFEFRKIRGQLSWFEPTTEQLAALPKLPLKYGGYCSLFTPTDNDDKLNPVTPHTPTFLLGASFVRNDTDTSIRSTEHAVNRDKLITAIPELADVIDGFEGWQARVGIRAQTPDYHPLVGQVDEAGKIWTLSGMGSKGYAFAPLCAQVLADMMTGQFAPMPSKLLAKLSPHRKVLQKPLN